MINLEAVFWIGVILFSPGIYMLSRLFFEYILDPLISDDVVIINIEHEDGSTERKVLDLSSSDDLAILLRSIRAKRTPHSGGGV